MGKLTQDGRDLAASIDEGTIDAAGAGPGIRVIGRTNVTLSGTFTGTLRLERSFDGGQNFVPVTVGGQIVDLTGPMSEELDELEDGMLYRFRATAFSAGAALWRFSR